MMDAIMNAELNTNVDVPAISAFKTVRFTYDDTLGYTWVAQTKHDYVRNVWPMRTVHDVKFFKTLSGAKRNFIKRIK